MSVAIVDLHLAVAQADFSHCDMAQSVNHRVESKGYWPVSGTIPEILAGSAQFQLRNEIT